jgi:hypothetical protein
MKACGVIGCIDPHFFYLGTSCRRVVSFTPRETCPGTHSVGRWVNHRAGLDDVEKRKFLTVPGLELRPLGPPTRSQLLYRLRYAGCMNTGMLH